MKDKAEWLKVYVKALFLTSELLEYSKASGRGLTVDIPVDH